MYWLCSAGSLIRATWRCPPYRSWASQANDIPQPRKVFEGRAVIRPVLIEACETALTEPGADPGVTPLPAGC